MAGERISAMVYKIAILIPVTTNGVANKQRMCKF